MVRGLWSVPWSSVRAPLERSSHGSPHVCHVPGARGHPRFQPGPVVGLAPTAPDVPV